jgi:hypothetical protein
LTDLFRAIWLLLMYFNLTWPGIHTS